MIGMRGDGIEKAGMTEVVWGLPCIQAGRCRIVSPCPYGNISERRKAGTCRHGRAPEQC